MVAIRSILWLSFFCVILASWAFLYMMAMMSGVDLIGRPVGMNMMPMETFGPLFAMWAIMMAAMMLPTMVPTLRAYEDLMQSANGTRAGWLGVLLGYAIVWVAFAALIAAAQLWLASAGLVDELGIAPTWLSAGLLVVVGAFSSPASKKFATGFATRRRCISWATGALVRLVVCAWGLVLGRFVSGVVGASWRLALWAA